MKACPKKIVIAISVHTSKCNLWLNLKGKKGNKVILIRSQWVSKRLFQNLANLTDKNEYN